MPIEVKDDTKQDVLNMHKASMNEIKVGFSAALNKDRLYHRPCGFVNDQQIWMLGVNVSYFLKQVLRMDHSDFLTALNVDVGIILGEVGKWVLTNLLDDAKASGDKEAKKLFTVALDILESYNEKGLTILS